MNPNGYPNDIALLRLKQKVDWGLYNVQVELGCLPPTADFNVTAQNCWISGWGKVDCKSEITDKQGLYCIKIRKLGHKEKRNIYPVR